MERARALADKLTREHPADNGALVRSTWRSILAHEPEARDLNRALQFLATQSQNAGTRLEAAVELVRALLNVNEFLYVD